jgi:Undecaprenyl-phosphate galactose phosphotransferase WbaP
MKPELTVDGSLAGNLSTRVVTPEPSARPIGGALKRSFDVALSAIGIVIISPIFAVLAFLIWAQDGKKPFYSHWRIGRNGRPFKCLKFRSMVPNSSEVLAKLLRSDPKASREWAESQKLHNDPRITPLGRLLRSSSLDELPQLINVLRGEMSIVGPRPIVDAEITRYGQEFERYCACRPGLTGLWQVSGRSDTSYQDRVKFDCAYVSDWSLWLDMAIVVRTIPAVLSQRGSY